MSYSVLSAAIHRVTTMHQASGQLLQVWKPPLPRGTSKGRSANSHLPCTDVELSTTGPPIPLSRTLELLSEQFVLGRGAVSVGRQTRRASTVCSEAAGGLAGLLVPWPWGRSRGGWTGRQWPGPQGPRVSGRSWQPSLKGMEDTGGL